MKYVRNWKVPPPALRVPENTSCPNLKEQECILSLKVEMLTFKQNSYCQLLRFLQEKTVLSLNDTIKSPPVKPEDFLLNKILFIRKSQKLSRKQQHAEVYGTYFPALCTCSTSRKENFDTPAHIKWHSPFEYKPFLDCRNLLGNS